MNLKRAILSVTLSAWLTREEFENPCWMLSINQFWFSRSKFWFPTLNSCFPQPHSLRKKERKNYGFAHFLALSLTWAETPLFAHLSVFALWALRLESKYTIILNGVAKDSSPRICALSFKVPEGHHPRGTTLRGFSVRGFWKGGSALVLRLGQLLFRTSQHLAEVSYLLALNAFPTFGAQTRAARAWFTERLSKCWSRTSQCSQQARCMHAWQIGWNVFSASEPWFHCVGDPSPPQDWRGRWAWICT